MHCLRFRITALAPLVISTTSGDRNMVATKQFIPGTTVLGVLASRFIQQQRDSLCGRPAHENEDFCRWFLSGRLQFSNANILSQDEYGERVHHPTPLSIAQEKNGVTAYDYLFLDPDLRDTTIPVGDHSVLKDGLVETRTVKTSINFHHDRDPSKGIARRGPSQEGLIFNYESIDSDQVFEGIVSGEVSDLRSLLDVCGSTWTASIGRSRTAQYGAAEFRFVETEPVPLPRQITWPTDEEGQPAQYISMTLLSDSILYNEHGYPTTDTHYLEEELQKHLGEVEIRKAFVRKSEVESFVGVWGLKKPSEISFVAGSCFLLRTPPDRRKQLAQIQQHGIGERTHEGFGQCAFGLQTTPTPYLPDETERKDRLPPPPRPDEPLPKVTKDIIVHIIKEEIAAKIGLGAVIRQAAFNSFPSNTLIVRLRAMARSAHSVSEFAESVNKLRDIALNQLRKSNLLGTLVAFELSENSIKGLEQSSIDTELVERIRQLPRHWRYVLITDLEKAIERKLSDSQRSLLLKHVRFREAPIDWDAFLRDRDNARLKALCQEIGVHPQDDAELTRELLGIHWETFFSTMRQRAILKWEGQDG